MRTRARVRCAGVNFKERLDEKRSGGMVYMLRVKQVFYLTKGTRVVIPGLIYSFVIQLIGGGSVKNFQQV